VQRERLVDPLDDQRHHFADHQNVGFVAGHSLVSPSRAYRSRERTAHANRPHNLGIGKPKSMGELVEEAKGMTVAGAAKART
jgi:hypothetical protein